MQESLLRTQDLENALMYEEYGEAARLAFRLGHPGKLLRVVNAILDDAATAGADEDGAGAWQAQLGRLVADFNAEEIKKALEYSQEWNTKARSCMPAQAMVGAILANHQRGDLIKVPGIGELLEGLTAYSGRHFRRLTQLMRSTFLLDYMLTGMKSVLPDGEGSGEEDTDTWQVAMHQGGSGAAVGAGAADTKPVVEHHSNGDEVEAMVEEGVEEELGASSRDGEAKEDDEEETPAEQTPKKRPSNAGGKRRRSTGAELTPNGVGKQSTKKVKKEGKGAQTAVKSKRSKKYLIERLA